MNGFNAQVRARMGEIDREMVRNARRSRLMSLVALIPLSAATAVLCLANVALAFLWQGNMLTAGINLGIAAMLVANIATSIQFVQHQNRTIALFGGDGRGSLASNALKFLGRAKGAEPEHPEQQGH